MPDDDTNGPASLLQAGAAAGADDVFASRLERGLRRARMARTLAAIAAIAGIVIAAGAALSLSVIFLGLARGRLADSPGWDITGTVFWIPYGVVCLTLAVFLRELTVQLGRRHL